MEYYTPAKSVRSETVINRSRFICTVSPVIDEPDAIEKLKSIRKEFSDATHNVYCYIADKNGNTVRFSDDGEPQGTSALPMLDVLKKKNLVKVLCVVTRYFGGIKLGANGLVGAYSSAVSTALEKATVDKYIKSVAFEITVNYSLSGTVENVLKNYEHKLLSIEYNDNVIRKVSLPTETQASFMNKLLNATAGKVTVNQINLDEDFILY